MTKYREVTFLVVEDDDLDFKILKRAFKNLKITNPVRRAHDGIEALDILKGQNGQEKISLPYLILLDLKMPRMGGLEFLDNLRSDPDLHKDIVFVLTTSDAESDVDEAYKQNVAGYIKKGDPEEGFEEAIRMIDHYWKVVEFRT
ncbi:MAG: response regulator [Rhodospirillales bacterium]